MWRRGVAESDRVDLAELDVLLADRDVLVWVDILSPDGDTLASLAAELAFDPHAVEDAVSRHERVKLTVYEEHLFLTLYHASIVDDPDEPEYRSRLVRSQVSAFVLPRGLVTVRRDERFDVDDLVQRWADNSRTLQLGVGALVHGLLDTIVDGHFDALQRLDEAVEDLEEGLFSDAASAPSDLQRGVHRLRTELAELRRVVLPMREVVSGLMRLRMRDEGHDDSVAGRVIIGTGLDAWYDDLYDHVLRAMEACDSQRDMTGSVFETSIAIQDARLNIVMKKLAGWAAVIAVPTAITGWFGQNVPFPGAGTGVGVLISAVAIVAGSGILYVVLRHYDWI